MPNPRARRAAPASAAPSESASVADTSPPVAENGTSAKTPVGDHGASVLHRVAPKYPVSALRNNSSGTVTVGVQVDADGKPDKVRIEKSSGSRDLDRAAREAVMQWQFSPKVENGSPVSSELLIPVEFKLGD
jgi:protein TonB